MARVYEKFRRERLSRRRLLGGAAGTAVGVAALAACGGGSDGGNGEGAGVEATVAGDETPTVGGVLRIVQTSPWPNLSPFGPTSLVTSGVFGFISYDHLWYVPFDTGEVVPFLAENIEVVDEEGLQTNITMKQSFFHNKPPVNGRMVLASDIPPSWDRFRTDPFGLGREWLRNIMDSVEPTGDLSLTIRQKQPFAWMFGSSAAGSAFSSSILPVEILDDDDFLAREVIGSGPHVLTDHRNGENVQFRTHENWREPNEPLLGGVDYSLITEPTAAQAQFRAGNIDTIGFSNKLEADQMKGDLGDRITVTSALSRSYNVLMLKFVPPFDDERVRRGINLALNREELIQLVELDPEGGRASSIVPPAQEFWALPDDDPDVVEYFRHDPVEAKSMLETAGFDFDRSYTLKYPSGEETEKRAVVLQRQLGAVGIDLNLAPEDLLTVWLPNTLNGGDFEMTLFTHLPYEDAYLPLAFYSNQSPIGPVDDERGRNNMGYFDDDVIAATEAASLELDIEARREKVHDAERLIMQKMGPMLNLYAGVGFGARYNWYKGVISGRGSFGTFTNLRRAWIDTALRGS